jgi:hypothetical protein
MSRRHFRAPAWERADAQDVVGRERDGNVAGSRVRRRGCDQDGITAKERSDLDNAAAMLDGNQIVDTSADSLVLEEEAARPSKRPAMRRRVGDNAAAGANEAAPAE